MNEHHYSVILAGGSGTRLWPLSRKRRPKQLLPLTGEQSLLMDTAKRLLERVSADHIFTVTHATCAQEVSGQLQRVHAELGNFIFSEPLARNTLLPVAWMAEKIFAADPEAIISVFPADHAMGDSQAFFKAWDTAIEAVTRAPVVLIGMMPTGPSTEYGYLRVAEAVPLKKAQAITVEAFVEKPDLETACEYLRTGHYLWNGGIFVFRADQFLALLKKHQPVYALAGYTLANAKTPQGIDRVYQDTPGLSIDYGLMEKAQDLLAVPANMRWTDLGSWEALFDFHSKDSHENVMRGNVLALDSQRNLLITEKGCLAVLGLDNLVVVQTHDATLVANRSQVHQLKSLYEEVQASHPELTESPQREDRPWGWFEIIHQDEHTKVKRIAVKPKQKLSLQAHAQRSENWVVVAGEAAVTCGDEVIHLKKGQSVFIPQTTKHRAENRGDVLLEFIEVQTGNYLGEDDIIRFEDDYGRTTHAC